MRKRGCSCETTIDFATAPGAVRGCIVRTFTDSNEEERGVWERGRGLRNQHLLTKEHFFSLYSIVDLK